MGNAVGFVLSWLIQAYEEGKNRTDGGVDGNRRKLSETEVHFPEERQENAR